MGLIISLSLLFLVIILFIGAYFYDNYRNDQFALSERQYQEDKELVEKIITLAEERPSDWDYILGGFRYEKDKELYEVSLSYSYGVTLDKPPYPLTHKESRRLKKAIKSMDFYREERLRKQHQEATELIRKRYRKLYK